MMLRRSVPGHLDYIDLGPGAASTSGVRGTFVVPEREVPAHSEQGRKLRLDRDPAYAERRRQQRRAADARYRAARRATA